MATKSVLEMFCICSFFLPLKQHSNVESVNDSQMQITCLQHKEEHFVCPQNKERKITILMIFVYSWLQQAARPTVAGFFGKNNELHSSLKVTRSTQRQVLWQYHINSKPTGRLLLVSSILSWWTARIHIAKLKIQLQSSFWPNSRD
jgi:hypothetical protein